MMIYFIVFGDTSAQLLKAMTKEPIDESSFYTSKWFYVCIIAALLLPLVLQKDLAELKIISYILFVSLFLFVFVNLGELLFDPRFVSEPRSNIWVPKFGIELIQALSITLVAYSY